MILKVIRKVEEALKSDSKTKVIKVIGKLNDLIDKHPGDSTLGECKKVLERKLWTIQEL